jgi:hypothetical protein
LRNSICAEKTIRINFSASKIWTNTHPKTKELYLSVHFVQ